MEINVLGVHRVAVSKQALKVAAMLELKGTSLKKHLDGLRLVEVLVTAPDRRLDLSMMGQFRGAKPGDMDQSPYDERFFSADALTELDESQLGKLKVYRTAFFLHFVDLQRPLRYRKLAAPLPTETPMPVRLAKVMRYEFP